jgi:hypothetical protein
MLPLVLTELAEQERSRLVIQLLSSADFSKQLEEEIPRKILNKRAKLIELYGENGGLPGICFMRSERLRQQRLTLLIPAERILFE